jgi:hypothetical protein
MFAGTGWAEYEMCASLAWWSSGSLVDSCVAVWSEGWHQPRLDVVMHHLWPCQDYACFSTVCAACAGLLLLPLQATRRGPLGWVWSGWRWCCLTSLTLGAPAAAVVTSSVDGF